MGKIEKKKAIDILLGLSNRIEKMEERQTDSAAYKRWSNDVEAALRNIFGKDSIQSHNFGDIWFFSLQIGTTPSEDRKAFEAGAISAAELLRSMANEIAEFWLDNDDPKKGTKATERSETASKQVFVVHGHKIELAEVVARFLSKLSLEPIILHEKASEGQTIIEKIEKYAISCAYAVIMLTADDLGGLASPKLSIDDLKSRARQNVVFEMGYFIGNLGRKKGLRDV